MVYYYLVSDLNFEEWYIEKGKEEVFGLYVRSMNLKITGASYCGWDRSCYIWYQNRPGPTTMWMCGYCVANNESKSFTCDSTLAIDGDVRALIGEIICT